MGAETLTHFELLFGIAAATTFLTMIFFVLFGQITVRKLRKNPATKDTLGADLISGWDILNVASALAMPRWLNKKMQNSSLFYLHANAEILDKNTTKLDRVLAIVFYALFVCSGILFILLMLYDTFFTQ